MIPVADALKAMGIGASDLFEEFLLPLDSPADSQIPAHAIYEMMEAIATRLDNPTIGSDLAINMIEDTYHFYGLDPGDQSSLAEMLTSFILSQREQYTSAPYRLAIGEELAILSKQRTNEVPSSTRQVDCWELTTLIEGIKRKVGKLWDSAQVHAAISCPLCLCQNVLPEQSLCSWDKSGVQVTLPSKWLIQPSNQAETRPPICGSPPPPNDFVKSVKAALRPRIAHGKLCLEDAADYCGVGVRQFQSMLHDQGLNFLSIQDELRKEHALIEIEKASKPIAEISYELGYSDSSAFSRAFKRWTGRSPEHHRDLLGSDPPR